MDGSNCTLAWTIRCGQYLLLAVKYEMAAWEEARRYLGSTFHVLDTFTSWHPALDRPCQGKSMPALTCTLTQGRSMQTPEFNFHRLDITASSVTE